MPKDFPDPRSEGPERSDTHCSDRREEFAKLSQKKPADVEAERAFLKSKIELARVDRNLSEDERARFIGELQCRLDSLSDVDESA